MKADPDVITVAAKPFPEPELYVLAVDLANIALSGRRGGKTAYEDVYKELMKRVGPALTAIDSILAEAGDERAPVLPPDVTWKPEIIQGWIDRLRGIRAALELTDQK